MKAVVNVDYFTSQGEQFIQSGILTVDDVNDKKSVDALVKQQAAEMRESLANRLFGPDRGKFPAIESYALGKIYGKIVSIAVVPEG